MEDILNATLAGGVIMGTPADMIRNGCVSLVVGFCAGLISCTGFNKLTSYLSEIEFLHDTCGVLNLHFIPGLLGALVGAVLSVIAREGDYSVELVKIWNKRYMIDGVENRDGTT